MEAAADPEQSAVCPKCGQVMPEPAKAKGTDWDGLDNAITFVYAIAYGGLALLLAGFLALALG